MNINELRKQYPQYDKVDDETLSQKLYEVHYAGKKGSNGEDIKYNDFRIKFLEKDTGFISAVGSGIDTVQGLGYRALKGWADSQYNQRDPNSPIAEFNKPIISEDITKGISAWADKGIQANEIDASKYAPTVPSYKDVDSFGSALDYAGGLTAQSIPYMAAAATPIGIAGMASGLSQEAYQAQPEDEKNALRAITSGAGQMALERIGLAGVLGRLSPKGAGFTRRVGTGAIAEGSTEVGQDIVAQWGAGADIGEIDLSNWDENFVGGMAAGTMINAPIEAYKSISGGNAQTEPELEVSPLESTPTPEGGIPPNPEFFQQEQAAQQEQPIQQEPPITPEQPVQPIQPQAPITPVENQGYEFFSQEEAQGYDHYMLNDLANTAYNTDPQVTEKILSMPATVEQKIDGLNKINGQHQNYQQYRSQYDSDQQQQRMGNYNQSMDRMKGLQQVNEPIRQQRIKQEGIQQTKDDISLPKNNMTMLDMKSRVKAKRKKFKKILQTKHKGGLLALKAEKQMREAEKQAIRDRTGKRAGNYSMADKEQRVQQDIAQRRVDEWQATKLAREYQLAEEKGIDKEFSELATAVSRAIQTFPEAEQAAQNINAQEALAEYVEQEEANIEDVDNTVSPIDIAANEAATSPLNDMPDPTPAQQEAGNYKKGKLKIQGLDIAIENPKGSQRKGIDSDGKEWSTTMNHHYGDIKRTNGADGDPIDVFIGEKTESEKVFVVDQNDVVTGNFDEHKVMVGFDTKEEAKAAYLSNYSKGFSGFGEISETSMSEFKGWVNDPIKSAKPFNDQTPTKETQPETDNQQDYLAQLVKGDNSPKNLLSLKKALADRVGKKASDITNEEVKVAQEEMEAALVEKARGIVNRGMSIEATTKALTELYTSQPNLNMRSVDSVKNMAYSTPAPISYLANIVTGINRDTKVLEPTAGNGLLLLTNDKSKTTVNEYDPKRIKQLQWLGYTNILNKDATSNENLVKPKSQDAVIMNPPFGFFNGSYNVSSNDGLNYELKDIDHIIAAKQLTAMKDDGRAFLILGANKEAGKVQGGKTGIFLNWLYNNYNVTDHIEVDGKIYTRQGAAWPIRMIAIDGRQMSNNDTYAPQNGEVKRIEGSSHAAIIDNVFKHYQQSGLLDTKRKQPIAEPKSDDSVSTQPDTNANEQVTSPEPRKPTTTRPTGTKPSQSASANGNSEPTRDNNTNEQGGTSTRVEQPVTQSDPNAGSKERESTVAESDSTSGRKGDTTNVSTGKAKSNSTTVKVERLNDFQAKYETSSGGFNQDILTPVNMAKNTFSALNKVSDKHGGIDNFVARELNFANTKSLHDAFMGLQVDSIALAIDKIEQGKAIIIADQTGVGKGRQAAGIIRYAIEKGHIPVFITQKANLFSDMYGDLVDIGSDGVSPFIFNNGEKVTHNGKDKFKDSPKVTKEKLAMLASGQLPDGDNAIFLTYSQIQNDPSNPNAQQKAISGIADKAIFILDESHTAAGTGNHLNTFMREKLTNAVGGVYLSATYAKRPDNLSLYNLTSISEAVDSKEELSEALYQGGLQLQTLLASMMSQEGELIRREKSFDGITINTLIDTENTDKHTVMFDKATDVLSDIVAFSKLFGSFIKGAKPSKDSPKGAVAYIGNATIDKDTKPTSFTSTVHNYIAQLTLAIKADSAADKAIASFKNGEKPVIALDNTMETKLNNYMVSSSTSIGESAADFTFADIFNDALNNATSLSVKTANGEKEKVQIPLSELSGQLQAMYKKIKNKANGIDFSDIPVSPIDHIRMRLLDAGVKVQEITGRGKFIDYSDNMIIKNKPAEESKENRISIVNRFNDGKIDAVILNQSGSTGLSLHAKEGFKDTKPRRMIVAQPSLDINIFMQMLGRINRTGQIALPRYDVLWLNLPSENRPAAVVSNKMKQLNANTSANTDSATSIDTVDFFNQYGNEIVDSYVKENPEILESLLISKSQYDNNAEDSALFLTGKIALLSVEKQRDFFEEVETAYTDHIATLKATGEYALETQDVDLDAKPVSQEIMQKGENTSAFNGDIKLTIADVKSQGKPVSPEDLQSLYDSANPNSGKGIVDALEGEFDQYIAKRFDKQLADLNEKLLSDADADTIKGYAEKIDDLQAKKRKEVGKMKEIKSQLSFTLREGSAIKINLNATQDAQGAIASITHKHKAGQGNPYAPSKFKVKILTASGYGTISTSLSQLNGGMLEKSNHIDRNAMMFYFKNESKKPLREKRTIVTGNLVKAFSMLKSSGRVVSFTKASGGSEIGILLPASFDKENDVKKSVYVKSAEQLQTFLDNANSQSARIGLQNADGLRLFKHEGKYKVSIPATGKTKTTYLSDEMESIVGGIFYQNGSGNPVVEIDSQQLAKVYEFGAANAPFKVDGELADDFKRANNIDDGTGKVANSDIRFNKVEGNKKPKGVDKDTAQKLTSDFLKKHQGLLDDGFTITVTDKDPADLFKGATKEQLSGLIKGGFSKQDNRVFIFASSHQNAEDILRTLREELLVHKGLGLLEPTETADLLNKINQTRKLKNKDIQAIWDEVNENYGEYGEYIQAEEFLGKVAQLPIPQWERLLNPIVVAFTKMLRKLGLMKAPISKSEMRKQIIDISNRLASGERATNYQFDAQMAADSGLRFNKTSGKALPSKMNDATSKIAEFWSSLKSGKLRKAAFKAVPVNQLIDVYDAEYTNGHIQGYYENLEAFSAYKAKEMSKIDEEVESQWHELQKSQPKSQEIMSRLMLNATMAQMSPDQNFEDQKIVQDMRQEQTYARVGTDEYAEVEERLNEAKTVYDQLREDWDYLTKNSPAAIKLYKDVRQAYITMHDQTKDFLLARIRELDTDAEVKRQLMTRIKLNFEKALQKGDYFPLSRTGQFKVVARKGKEYVREHYDNEMQANKAAKQWNKEGYKTKVQKMEDPYKDNNPMAGYQMGKNLLSIIDDMRSGGGELNFGAEQEQDILEINDLIKGLPVNVETSQLIDAIYQQMLHTLPNASAAKHFIHRNRVKGASTDMRRGFANTMYHSINRAAKIQYEHKFAEDLNAIKDIAESTDGAKQPVVRDIHESLAERNEMTLNPKGNQYVAWASGLGFNWLLGGSIAAGMVNLSQVPIITIPYLTAKYGKGAYTEFLAAQKYVYNPKTLNKKQGKNALDTVWKSVSQTDSFLDISKNPNLPMQERKLLEKLQEDGKIDVTQMHSLAQIADTETRDYKGVSKVKLDVQRAWGFFFHNAEVMNRQVTALMAMRLHAKAANPKAKRLDIYKGLDFNELYDVAATTIDDTQYNYASANRGVWARTDFGKLVFMFMTYTVNTITLMAKNTKRSFVGKDAKTREEARRFMGNALAMQFVFAGAIGLPAVEFIGDVIFGLINIGDEEGDEDFKLFLDESIRYATGLITGDPNDDISKASSEVIRKGLVNYATGMNVASRVGMNNLLWMSSNRPDRTGTEIVSDIATGASPLISITANFINGGQRLMQGVKTGDTDKTLRGMQGLLPKAIGDVFKGVRQANYGESTLSGSELLTEEEITAWNGLSQAIGFSGAQVSEMYERRGRKFSVDNMLKNRKNILVRKTVNLIKESGSLDDVIKDIQKFNSKHPDLAITADTIRRHMMNKATRAAQTQQGIYLPKSQEYKRDKMKYYDN